MSKIQGKPFIEKVVATLTEEQKITLVGLVNGTSQVPNFRSLINSASYITNADKGVSHVVLEAWNKTYTGYLVYNDNYCVLLAYANNTQDMVIVKINLENQSYKLVREALTILELRYVLEGIDGGADVPVVLETSNITALTNDEISGLKAGDVVVKVTGNQKHSYRVSYKENGQGICLTYTDASVAETVSYDYVGDTWTYNSTDVTPLAGQSVVELSNVSGTLSDSDYAKVQQDNCIIKVSTQYFYKAFSASTLIVYQAFSRQAGQDQALFDYVEITKSTKAWELKADNIVEANPTVPEGTTPTDLTGLKVGNTYLAINPATFVDWS
jgi:hypothetical protein